MAKRTQIMVAVGIFVCGGFVGYLGRQYPHKPQGSAVANTEQLGTREVIGSWRLNLKPPSSVELPQDHPVVRLQFGKPFNVVQYFSDVTVSNLTDTPLAVSYRIYTYDSKNRRVGEYEDKFRVGSRESVARQATLSTTVWLRPPMPALLVVDLEVSR